MKSNVHAITVKEPQPAQQRLLDVMFDRGWKAAKESIEIALSNIMSESEFFELLAKLDEELDD
jgi:hypothetical protein